MDKKAFIRKQYFLKRKKNYFRISPNYFNPLIKLLKKKNKVGNLKISIYFPSSFEVDLLRIIEIEYFRTCIFLLPVIENNNTINFYRWKKNDVLKINKYGIPEPIKSHKEIPDVALVPLLAFDKNKNRLGYGKGFYDKYLNNQIKINKKNILTVGIAFSFQKHHNLPIKNNDYNLDYVITEKGIIE